eukprot:TRINITY_DN14225_c0_g1_i1.p1 TRINITY_DN14225_c0_g1~~TRINITY_DN14225_c0_g1_i1.p1  ORF type:complete len:249 (-),score=50.42 TRINITY_DN14225_c0_g1_i1:446-1192(-)
MSDAEMGSDNEQPTSNGGGRGKEIKPWTDRIEVSIARSRKVKGGNYVQLATADLEGVPHNRTIVFRGWVTAPPELAAATKAPGGKAMKFITDARSCKVSQRQDVCELVWWFAKSSEQYRVAGRLEYIGQDGVPVGADNTKPADGSAEAARQAWLCAERKQAWGNLSDPAREQFYWKSPGVSYEGLHDTGVPTGGRDAETNKVLDAPENFLLLLLWPKRCDYLRLTDNFRQLDDTHGSCQDWVCTRTNP